MSVSGSVDHFDRLAAERNDVSIFDRQVDVGRIGGFVHDHLDAMLLAQHLARGVMIGMGMGIDRVKQFGRKEFSQLDVLVGLVELRIDDDAFFFLRTAQEIGQAAARPDLLEDDIHVIEADLFNYQSDRQYDIVSSFGLIEHFGDTKDIISRHVSFLKPGGKLFITLPNFRSVNGWVQRTFDKSNYDKHNISSMDPQFLASIATELGLKEVRSYYSGGFSIWLENRKQHSVLTRACVKLLWYAGKVPTKIFRFESRVLAPYIILECKR